MRRTDWYDRAKKRDRYGNGPIEQGFDGLVAWLMIALFVYVGYKSCQ